MHSSRGSLRAMVYAAVFGALTAAGAYIVIPLPLVPITLQTLFSYLAGALLGGYWGVWSQVIYVLLGVIGLPVFAGGAAGPGVLLGPTGGYLFGFILGTYVVGKLVEIKRAPGLAWLLVSMVAGTAVIYTLGTVQLALVAGLSPAKALSVGVLPFIPGDCLKIVAAALIALRVRDRLKL